MRSGRPGRSSGVLAVSLSEKQVDVLQHCDHRWNVKTGATGSGKSWLDYAVVIPKRLMALKGEGAVVILGNTQGTANRNILEPMRDIWGDQLVGTINSSDNSARLFGRRVYVMGADNRKHVARIQGMTIEYAYGDEVTTWAEGVFQMLKSRLRCPHSHFDGTCNPDAPQHWFKAFLDSGADIYCQASTIFDNPFLPPEFVENLCKEYAGTVYYNRFILGQWVAAEGVVYRQFADDPERFIVKGLPPQRIRRAVIGVDFGGGTSAHAFCCMGFTDGGALVVLDEYHEQQALTPNQLAAAFVDFVRRCQARWLVADCWCDSAEQTLINGLRSAAAGAGIGLNIGNALKRPINDRIRATCILMGSGRFFVASSCAHTIDALKSALWDSKHVTEDVRLDDGTTNIDSLDAMEYSFEREIPALIDSWRET